MTPNNRQEFSDLIDDTFAAFNRDPRPGTKEQYWNVLRKFGIGTIREAFATWVSNEDRAPTPAGIRRLAFDVSRASRTENGGEDFVLIDRVHLYTKPQANRNPKGNPHDIALPDSIASRKQGESAERFEERIADEVTFARYPKMRSVFQR